MSDEKRKIDELDRRVTKLEKQANDFSVNYYEIKKEGIDILPLTFGLVCIILYIQTDVRTIL